MGKRKFGRIFFANAQKINLETAEFVGVCILMSDQNVTPIFISLTLSASRDSIAAYRVFLGESGGRLGISHNLANTQKLLMTMSARLKNIEWSYVIGNDAAQ
jgi:hypothetical protein